VPVPIEEQLRSAVAQGLSLAGVPLSAAAMMRRSPSAPGQLDVSVSVAVPASVKGPLATVFGLVDERGAVRTGRQVEQAPAGGGDYTMTFLVPVAPGAYRFRFAAADAAGAIGSIEWPVSVKLATLGPFTASDVLTWYMDPAGKGQLFALEEIPPGVTTLNVSLELYLPEGASPPEDVKVNWTLVPGGQEKPAVEQEAAPIAGADLLRADAAFEMTDLPGGLYTVRARMIIDGAAVGSASTTIRKK
jgi:hypothetical protein